MDNKFGINDKVYVIDRYATGVIALATIIGVELDTRSPSLIHYRCRFNGEDKDSHFVLEWRLFSTAEEANRYCDNKRIRDLTAQKVKLLDKICEIDKEIESLTKS